MRRPLRTSTQSAGASGRSPDTSVNVAPASWETNRWPVPTRLTSSPCAPGGVQWLRKPPGGAEILFPPWAAGGRPVAREAAERDVDRLATWVSRIDPHRRDVAVGQARSRRDVPAVRR